MHPSVYICRKYKISQFKIPEDYVYTNKHFRQSLALWKFLAFKKLFQGQGTSENLTNTQHLMSTLRCGNILESGNDFLVYNISKFL